MTDAGAYTTTEAAARLGVSPQIVRLRARKNGIGRVVNARLRLFSDADLARLRAVARPPGRPRKRAPATAP